MELTKKQEEIYKALVFEYKTIKQIAHQRGVSRQAIEKTIKKLGERGLNLGGFNRGVAFRHHPLDTPHKIRLHAQHFILKIIRGSDTYRRAIGNRIKIDGNTIECNKENLEVYSNTDFFGDTPSEAKKKSLDYFFNIFKKIEDRLKILIVKDGYLNIKEANAHYSEINNELARDNTQRGVKLGIKGEDGKTWLKTDNSFNLNELETVHPNLAKEDMEKIKPFFDDLRANPMTLSDLTKATKELATQSLETARGLGTVVNILGINLKREQEQTQKETDKTVPEYIG